MNDFKFSGHDTFHCRQQWLSKGIKLIDNEGYTVLNRPEIAISKLGVGKNMVQSIQHWLKSFGLINDKHEILEIANKLFLDLLPKYEKTVLDAIKVPLTQNQFDALVSFCWNCGSSETLFKLVNENSPEAVQWWKTHYIKGGGKVLNGLVKRRAEEAELYNLN